MSMTLETLVPTHQTCFGWVEKERCIHCHHFSKTGKRMCINCQEYGAGEQVLCVNCAFEHEFSEGLGGANRKRTEVLPSYWFNLFSNKNIFNDMDEEYVEKVKRCCRILFDIIRYQRVCPEYLYKEIYEYNKFINFLKNNNILI